MRAFDPVTHLQVDYIGNSGIRQATLYKNTERSRIWTFAGVIDSAQHPGLFDEYAIRHDSLQRIVCGTSVWEQSADAWEIVSYAIQKDWPMAALAPCPSLQNGYAVPVHGLFVHGSQHVRLQSFRSILDGIPGLAVTWTPVYVGRGVNFTSTAAYKSCPAFIIMGLDSVLHRRNKFLEPFQIVCVHCAFDRFPHS